MGKVLGCQSTQGGRGDTTWVSVHSGGAWGQYWGASPLRAGVGTVLGCQSTSRLQSTQWGRGDTTGVPVYSEGAWGHYWGISPLSGDMGTLLGYQSTHWGHGDTCTGAFIHSSEVVLLCLRHYCAPPKGGSTVSVFSPAPTAALASPSGGDDGPWRAV